MEKKKVQPLLDAVEADPEHYTVELENDMVRVVRAVLGPREKSRMHSHNDSVAVHLTDLHVRFAFPDGRTDVLTREAGEVKWLPAFSHEPENLTDDPIEVLFIEIKSEGRK